MNEISGYIYELLTVGGADLVAFGNISELGPEAGGGLPNGIAVAIKYPPEVILGISEMPTKEYRAYYDSINEQLDALVTMGAEALTAKGFRAHAQTRANVGSWEDGLGTPLPHKTVATRAGLGWIGKCALLVTEAYGSAIRLSSILTDAPLDTAEPVDESRCGSCRKCFSACPGKAVVGPNWFKGAPRESYFDAAACRKEARSRALAAFNEDVTICGRCIHFCPYTQKYLKSAAE